MVKVVKISQGKVKAGELPKDKYDMSLTYYKQTIAGKVIHEIDVINMVRIIDSVDVLADIRNAIGI
ncbi:phage major tail tube protein [Acinetobacter baumannii]|nr:phage major tail tube protein [Acinetobacter baumannii]